MSIEAQEHGNEEVSQLASHRQRQRRRQGERKQLSLEGLLKRIPFKELDASVSSAGDLASLYEPIPSLAKRLECSTLSEQSVADVSSTEWFWQCIPPVCTPDESALDQDVADPHLLAQEATRQAKYEKKLRRKLEDGDITADQMRDLLVKRGRSTPALSSRGALVEETATCNCDEACGRPPTSTSGHEFSLMNADRGRRKRLQVENFASILLEEMERRPVTAAPLTVVDFGCGSGNLCLSLAAFFGPKAKFVFVDCNEQALKLVESRAAKGKLSAHIQTTQYNFTSANAHDVELPAFDIGIGLHCCGSFTDVVMELCWRRGAGCIVCPCCNGRMTNESTGGYKYPRSQLLRKYLSEDEYLLQLSRSADDLGNYSAKCLVELDRALWARETVEHGDEPSDRPRARFSDVRLLRLDPMDCSPKHHVLQMRPFRP